TASSSINRSPPFAIITGSTTRNGISRSLTAAATASTIAALASIPVLAACAPMSATTASICAVTRSADTASNMVTPSVFCAGTSGVACAHGVLGRVRADVGDDGFDLRGHQIGRHRFEHGDAERVLRGDGGDGGRAV